jgi:SHS2 domain-containing protein
LKNYELIEHTADFGIRVKGKDPEEIFKNAAEAMFDCIATRINPAENSIQAKINQEAEDLEELFVNWLNELLSLSATKEVVFTGFKIHKISDTMLQAEAIGEPMQAFKINTEIKAATYHQLKIEKAAGSFQAEVIFDV